VGGTWAFADIVFLGLLPVAEHFGSNFVLKFSPIGYLISGVLGIFILFKTRNKSPLTIGVN